MAIKWDDVAPQKLLKCIFKLIAKKIRIQETARFYFQ